MNYIESQLFVSLAYIVKWQTEILSGNYKNRDITRGGVQLTDEAKLKDSMGIISRHIDRMQELSEEVYKLEKK